MAKLFYGNHMIKLQRQMFLENVRDPTFGCFWKKKLNQKPVGDCFFVIFSVSLFLQKQKAKKHITFT